MSNAITFTRADGATITVTRTADPYTVFDDIDMDGTWVDLVLSIGGNADMSRELRNTLSGNVVQFDAAREVGITKFQPVYAVLTAAASLGWSVGTDTLEDDETGVWDELTRELPPTATP